MRLLDDIIGKEILDNQANVIGKVKDIEIDTSSNKIESIIIIKENKKYKLGKDPEEKIPFEEIGKIGDKIILNERINDIKELLDIR